MSEETTTEAQETAQETETTETDWKAESRKWEERSKANKAALDAKTAEIEALQQKETEKSADAEAETAIANEFGFEDATKNAGTEVKPAANEAATEKANLEVARYKLALKYGLPEEDIEIFLTGDSTELLEKQAEALSKRSAPQVKPDLAQGKRNGTGPKTAKAEFDAWLDSL